LKVIPDVTIKNVPAIEMEEVAPVSMSASNALAPEEVYQKKKNDLKGTSELSQEERKAQRRAKKAAKQKKSKSIKADAKIKEKLQPGSTKMSKEKALEEVKNSRVCLCHSQFKKFRMSNL
jgi:U3 small nucleolar RNA-associated protein MPP10